MKNQFDYISKNSFSNAIGNDAFPLGVGSSGSRVDQLQQALRILGESVTESNFGNQTRTALSHLGYPVLISNEAKFNEIILKAYSRDKGKITLTEPELHALYEQDVPSYDRYSMTFEKWLKRENIKTEVGQGAKVFANVLLGWLKAKYIGAGDSSGIPNEQPVPTDTGWFSRPIDGGIPKGYYIIGAALGSGLIIWGAIALAKHKKSGYKQPLPNYRSN